MFKKLFEKLNDAAHHHQVIILLVVGFSIVCASWGVEGILEDYVFKSKTLAEYVSAILGGLSLLWITKHYILHAL